MDLREVCEVSNGHGGRVSWDEHITHQLSIEPEVFGKINCLPKPQPGFQAIDLYFVQCQKVTSAGEVVLPWF